jgi:hypothetical protein
MSKWRMESNYILSDDEILEKILSGEAEPQEQQATPKKKHRTAAKTKRKALAAFLKQNLALRILELVLFLMLIAGLAYGAYYFRDYWMGANVGEITDQQVYEAGTYLTGSDIKAGTYLITSSTGNSYVQVATSQPATLETMVMNDSFTTFRYVEVKKGDYITAQDATFTAIDDADPLAAASDGNYYDGMYLIGRDISAGTYTVMSTGDENVYIEILSDASGTFESLISNDCFSGEKTFTFVKDQYVRISNGAIAGQ